MRRLSIGNAFGAALLLAGSLWGQIPEISYDSTPNFLKLPEHVYLGEAAGVATNSKGNIFVYTRTGGTFATTGASRTFRSEEHTSELQSLRHLVCRLLLEK